MGISKKKIISQHVLVGLGNIRILTAYAQNSPHTLLQRDLLVPHKRSL